MFSSTTRAVARYGPLLEQPLEEVREVLDADVIGLLAVSQVLDAASPFADSPPTASNCRPERAEQALRLVLVNLMQGHLMRSPSFAVRVCNWMDCLARDNADHGEWGAGCTGCRQGDGQAALRRHPQHRQRQRVPDTTICRCAWSADSCYIFAMSEPFFRRRT